MYLPELMTIKTIFNNYKNLGATDLQTEDNDFTHKMDELVRDLENKIELKELLDEEIKSLKNDVELLVDTLEKAEIELIRSRQETKKVKKSIEKLRSFNLSRIKIDVSERDKVRIGKNHSKLFLLKLLTGIISVNTDGKLLLHDNSDEGSEMKIVQLNKNNTKEANSENVWESIHQCSKFKAQWESLFFTVQK